eukprot:1141962-Pelagomonas_calceolata.AAC.10
MHCPGEAVHAQGGAACKLGGVAQRQDGSPPQEPVSFEQKQAAPSLQVYVQAFFVPERKGDPNSIKAGVHAKHQEQQSKSRSAGHVCGITPRVQVPDDWCISPESVCVSMPLLPAYPGRAAQRHSHPLPVSKFEPTRRRRRFCSLARWSGNLLSIQKSCHCLIAASSYSNSMFGAACFCGV